MKIGILTINDNNNYGNRLQNYAVQKVIKDMNFESVTLRNIIQLNEKHRLLLRLIKSLIKRNKLDKERKKCFEQFNKNIVFSKRYVTPYSKISSKYNYFLTRK